MRAFAKKATAEDVTRGIDLRGKRALVTGANTGLGKETARVMALRGAHVTLACRDEAKFDRAKKDILDSSAGHILENQLQFLRLNLNRLDDVRAAADEFNNRGESLDVLVNNAGIMIPMERRTDDGFEAHLGINHLGHFLFTNRVMDSLLSAESPRVVVVSSSAMGMATLTPDLSDINWKQRKFSGMRSYGDSKLMNAMFARSLDARYRERGLVANALHPGVIATELARDQSPLLMLLGIFALPFMKSVQQGAATSVYLATSAEAGKSGGRFYSNCNEAKPAHPLQTNDEVCRKLWDISADLVGL